MGALNAKVYEAVAARSEGRCEECQHLFGATLTTRPELDHAEGRSRSESVATCWMLCGACHHAKTRNDPSAAWWLAAFALHCQKHDYGEPLKRALTRLQFVTTKSSMGAQP
jgi:hypothetical protein